MAAQCGHPTAQHRVPVQWSRCSGHGASPSWHDLMSVKERGVRLGRPVGRKSAASSAAHRSHRPGARGNPSAGWRMTAFGLFRPTRLSWSGVAACAMPVGMKAPRDDGFNQRFPRRVGGSVHPAQEEPPPVRGGARHDSRHERDLRRACRGTRDAAILRPAGCGYGDDRHLAPIEARRLGDFLGVALALPALSSRVGRGPMSLTPGGSHRPVFSYRVSGSTLFRRSALPGISGARASVRQDKGSRPKRLPSAASACITCGSKSRCVWGGSSRSCVTAR
jgi:hypothetical protein